MKQSLDQVKEFLRDAAVLKWMRIKEHRKNGNTGSILEAEFGDSSNHRFNP